MRSTYIERIQKLSEKLSDPALAERARKINSNTFSRNRKMPLKDILLCCLSKKGLTTTLELRNYFFDCFYIYLKDSFSVPFQADFFEAKYILPFLFAV